MPRFLTPLIFACATASSLGQCNPTFHQLLYARDLTFPGSTFAFTTFSHHEDHLAIALSSANTSSGASAGLVQIWRYSGTAWELQTQVSAPDGTATDRFGSAVSLSDEFLIVGAFGEDSTAGSDSGAVYVFRRSGDAYSFSQKLAPSALGAGDSFGLSLAFNGSSLAVGARFDDIGANVDVGSVYLYTVEQGEFVEHDVLRANDGAARDEFGTVAMHDDLLVVAARRSNAPTAADAGAVYVYQAGGSPGQWELVTKLTAVDAATNRFFGESLSIHEGTIVVGATSDPNAQGTHSHWAYVFEESNASWAQVAKLVPSDTTTSDYFGSAVSIHGDMLVVGAFSAPSGSQSTAGAAYLFARDQAGWSEVARLPIPATSTASRFGAQVLVGEDTAFVSSLSDSAPWATRTASVAVIDLHGRPVVKRHPQSTFMASGTTNVLMAQGDSADPVEYRWFHDGVEIPGATGARLDLPSVSSDDEGTYQAVALNDCAESSTRSASVSVGCVQPDEPTQLVGPTPSPVGLGTAIAVDGVHMLVGQLGSVVVYELQGGEWVWRGVLASPNGAGTNFGAAIDVSGRRAIIGAPFDSTLASQAGAAHVYEFERGQWLHVQTLTASDGASGDQFGTSVCLAEGFLVVGAPLDNTSFGSDAGSAYLFERTGIEWLEFQRLQPVSAGLNGQFGTSVGTDGIDVAVGAVTNGTPLGSGTVTRFQRGGQAWTRTSTLLVSGGGSSLAFSGDLMLVGAQRRNSAAGSTTGAAILYELVGDVWTQVQVLEPTVASSQARFGASCDLSQGLAIIGAPGDNLSATSMGSAHVFSRESDGSWRHIARVEPPIVSSGQSCGAGVAVAGDIVFVGTPMRRTATVTTGWIDQIRLGQGSCCRPDLTSSSDPNDPGYGVPDGSLDLADFFYYLDQFVAANLTEADLTGASDPNDPAYGVPDGMLDAADFFFFLDLFVQGCP